MGWVGAKARAGGQPHLPLKAQARPPEVDLITGT
jgi:hypothetical protein